MTKAVRRRAWTVDLTVGRRWWLLPLAGIIPLVAFRVVFHWVPEFITGDGLGMIPIAVAIAFAGWGVAATTAIAAILNVRGARPRHRMASAVAVLIGGVLLASDGSVLAPILYLAALSLFQLTVLRLVAVPKWRVRPSTKRGPGASVLFLLAITTTAAVIAAAVPHAGDVTSQFEWTSTILVAVASPLGLAAGGVGSRRWAVALGVFGGTAVVVLVGLASRGWGIFESMFWAEALVAMAAFTGCWTIGYFHRCDRKRRRVARS